MDHAQPAQPAFEIVCLGTGGGPLERDVLGYMCKPYASRWDEGWIGLEGGCGIGALTALLHQAILTTALRKLHETYVHHNPAFPKNSALPQPSTSGSAPPHPETTGHVALQTPPITASTSGGLNTNATASPKTPSFLAELGLAGLEPVHVEEETLFPGLVWPEDYQTPVLKAAWLFSHLTSYLITHAHFDHILSLVLATGSLPMPPALPASQDPTSADKTCPSIQAARRPVYASLSTLEKIEKVYQGDVWPELGCWAEAFASDVRRPRTKEELVSTKPGLVDQQAMTTATSTETQHDDSENEKKSALIPMAKNADHPPKIRRKSSLLASWSETIKSKGRRQQNSRELGVMEARRKSIDIVLSTAHSSKDVPVQVKQADLKVQPAYEIKSGVGVQYCATPSYPVAQRLPLRSATSSITGNPHIMSVLELPVSHGTTTQGIYESSAFFIRMSEEPTTTGHIAAASEDAEILFFGDIESSHTGPEAERLNTKVWKVAAEKWAKGTLRAIFIECSYTGSRPKHLMFGHVGPPCLYGELEIMASFLPQGETPPLDGLRVYVQHVKEPLVPEEPIKQKIARELAELEAKHRLGVTFVCLARGMRILI